MKPYRVLSLDGGGMRGTYTATFLGLVADGFAKRRGAEALDVGAGFDLIAGTSTGAIIACALAAGAPLTKVADLYRTHGPSIFRRPVPSRLRSLPWDLIVRRRRLRAGSVALRSALQALFGSATLAEVFAERKIALTIPAVELSQHRSWVFKTPHHPQSNGRDDNYPLVDVCLATTAAPIYRSLAAIDRPRTNSATPGFNVFADGGLWANNPVLVGLLEALELAAPDQPIEVFCLGTCPRPSGEQLTREQIHRNLVDWHFGGDVATLSIDAQEFAFDNLARMLTKHFSRECSVVRFPRNQISAELMPLLGLDDTRTKAIDALVRQASLDADLTNSVCSDRKSPEGELITDLFKSMPELAPTQT